MGKIEGFMRSVFGQKYFLNGLKMRKMCLNSLKRNENWGKNLKAKMEKKDSCNGQKWANFQK